ncbi:HAD family hydrolase [Kaarinaea lacus]
MKNWVFDLGAVLLEWDPQTIVSTFTSDADLQALLIREVFQHPDWLAMDRGQLLETDAIPTAAKRTNLEHQDIHNLFDIVRESLTIVPGALDILEKARDNNRDLYCLSNMSRENYTYLKDKYAFFNYFHGIVISGLENTMKPEREIFQILLQRFALNPDETLFIDDRWENTQSAAALGISTITFTESAACYQQIHDYLEYR